MTAPLLAFAIKLPLAITVFLVIAYAGTTNRRIAGVLFTFPILNGIAIIASDQPTVVADAIYPLVIFNCFLFAALISFPDVLPPLARLPRWARLFGRIVVWSLAWLTGAAFITDYRANLPAGGVLLGGAAVFAMAFLFSFWSAAATAASPRHHAARFVAFWTTRAALWRIVLFVITYGVVFWAARTAADQKWVGMASALPLPGFFALATLIDDAEEKSVPMATLLGIRDTLFLGPVLVIPFNWIFSHALLAISADAFVMRYGLLLAMWAMAALIVCSAVPAIANYFDRRKT